MSNIDIGDLITKYNLIYYVEASYTATDMLDHALNYPFKEFWKHESDYIRYTDSLDKFKFNKRVKIINDMFYTRFLISVCAGTPPEDPILFYLGFPSLESELDIIARYRTRVKDAILIANPAELSDIDCIYNIMGLTHEIEKNYNRDPYILITPKQEHSESDDHAE